MSRLRNFILAGVFLLSVVPAKASTPEPKEPWTIGAVVCLTGACSLYGKAALQGAQLAAAELNRSGGVLGRKVSVVAQDSQEATSGAGAISAFRKLRDSDNIHYYVGPTWTPAGQALGPILAKDTQIVMSSPSIGVYDFNREGENLFNMRGADESASRKLAHDIFESGLKKIAIYSTQQPWEKLQADAFQTEFEKLGGIVTTRQEPVPESTDARTHALKIVQTKPPAVFFATMTQLAAGAKALRTLKYSGKLFAIHVDKQRLDEAGDSIEGIVFANLVRLTAEFTKMFASHYGSDTVEMPAAIGYDIVMVYADAVRKSRSFNPALVQKHILQNKVVGKSGSFSFDEFGGAQREPFFRRIEDGEMVDIDAIP